MTPREADVAYVLEPVPGFVAVYAIDGGGFVVELDGVRGLAAAHYALLRVLSQEECAAVVYTHATRALPPRVAGRLEPLVLRADEREASRRRVPPAPAHGSFAVERLPASPARVLYVGDDPAVVETLSLLLAGSVVAYTVADAVAATIRERFDVIFCEGLEAFGPNGFLASVPLAVAERAFVLAEPAAFDGAEKRMGGRTRLRVKPFSVVTLGECLVRAGAIRLTEPILASSVSRKRALAAPVAGEPFTVLLTGVDDDVHEALRRVFREEARHIVRPDPADAAELALSRPLHAIVCGADAALHPNKSVLRAIAAEDPAGAARVVVVAPARDVPYVKHKLAAMKLANDVLPLPIDDAMLARAIYRDHPELLARAAVAEASRTAAEPLATRDAAVLVVDDDRTTEILLAAAEQGGVVLATTAMEAFEHVASRPVDLLVASATLRGDGGEPLYRTLWRMKPELKSRTVLVAPADAMPPSAPRSHPRRVVERPLTKAVLAEIVASFIR